MVVAAIKAAICYIIHKVKSISYSHHRINPPQVVDAVSFPTLLLTFSLCCLLRRWTAKFSALSSGPGVYSFPGQSVQRIRGRNIHFTLGGVVPAGGGGVMMISVSAWTAQCRIVLSKASYFQIWRRRSSAALSQSGGGGYNCQVSTENIITLNKLSRGEDRGQRTLTRVRAGCPGAGGGGAGTRPS